MRYYIIVINVLTPLIMDNGYLDICNPFPHPPTNVPRNVPRNVLTNVLTNLVGSYSVLCITAYMGEPPLHDVVYKASHKTKRCYDF